jgi:serine/threonine protein kinase
MSALWLISSALSADDEKRESLKWCQRLQIIKGVADGLAYLHGHSHVCIVHRNIGSRDILLDHDMNAKISDFGLAVMLAPDTYAEVVVMSTQ